MRKAGGWVHDSYLWCAGFPHNSLAQISKLSGLAEIKDISFRRDTDEVIVVFKSLECAAGMFLSGFLGAVPLTRYFASYDLLAAR